MKVVVCHEYQRPSLPVGSLRKCHNLSIMTYTLDRGCLPRALDRGCLSHAVVLVAVTRITHTVPFMLSRKGYMLCYTNQ